MNEPKRRKLPKYVYAEVANRRAYYYFRIGKGKRIRLPPPNSDEFAEAYGSAFAETGKKRTVATSGTLEWLINLYRESANYMAFSPSTRRARDNIFKQVVKKSGDRSYRKVTQSIIRKGRDARKNTPHQSRHFLDSMRGLFRWALDASLVNSDPTAGVKNPPRPKGPGFEIWEQHEIDAYRKHWLLGTKERVWLEVLIGTGARRGDAVTIGNQHVENGMISIKTQKQNVWAYVPILPPLKEAIKAGPTGELTFIVGDAGHKLKKEVFGNYFRKACLEVGIQKSAHGLRKYAATCYAEAGLTDAELESVFGWTRGSSMAAHYSKNAERRRLANAATGKIIDNASPKEKTISPNGKNSS